MSEFNRRQFLATTVATSAVVSLNDTVMAQRGSSNVDSISAMIVASDGKLIVADWKAAKLHAIELPGATPSKEGPFNVKALSQAIAIALKVATHEVRVHAFVFDSFHNRAIAAIQAGVSGLLMLALVTSDGNVKVVNASANVAASFDLTDAPAEGVFWADQPVRSLLVTDILEHDNAILVAGVSNAEFSSTLRKVPYPFANSAQSVSVEMYHTVHNQIESRAPIRVMSIVQLGDQPYLLAAYTCTPLITAPLATLFENGKVRAKTIAELGFGNTPLSMTVFTLNERGEKSQWILIANDSKDADLISLDAVKQTRDSPGLSEPVKVPFQNHAGVQTTSLPLTGYVAIRDQSPQFLLGLRRDAASGEIELVSIRKGAFFRLSDFINEYDFSGYSYPDNDRFQQQYIKPFHNMMKRDEGFDHLAK